MFNIFALAPESCQKAFSGFLKPWYHYLDVNNKCEVEKFTFLGSDSDIPLVLLVVIDDLLRIAGLVAVVFVLVGAVGFITSDGNPEKSAKARQTIINSLLGLAIAITAIVFVSFIGRSLGR